MCGSDPGGVFDVPRAAPPPPDLTGEVAFLLHWAAMSGVSRKNALEAWIVDRRATERTEFLDRARETLTRYQEAA